MTNPFSPAIPPYIAKIVARIWPGDFSQSPTLLAIHGVAIDTLHRLSVDDLHHLLSEKYKQNDG